MTISKWAVALGLCVAGNVVAAAARFATERKIKLSFLIEIDCGEHRSGLPAGSPDIVALARAIASASGLRLRGVMTHAGHSYGTDDPAKVIPVAAAERDAAVNAAEAIRAAGLPCEIVSIGSTPTVLLADHLRGVTEARPSCKYGSNVDGGLIAAANTAASLKSRAAASLLKYVCAATSTP